jgi:hypothetical protein
MKRIPGLMILAAAMMFLGPKNAGADDKGAGPDEPIVGLWQVTWTDADTHAVVLNVFHVWHADRMKTQNDTTHAPESQEIL